MISGQDTLPLKPAMEVMPDVVYLDNAPSPESGRG